ncbi:VOC family protein [Nocardiopsis potens]|uniref:VOC family protein n=1 Tax=Nocardiopsis potens TaxID=1246458 RepID=UPI0004784A61|nr:VOC family protein [Nocardiopsis potens]
MTSTQGPDRLPTDTAMGGVTLLVADLDAMTAYYRDAVTLQVLSADGGRVVLGRGATPIVTLQHDPGLKHASPSAAGLFHTAVLYDSREALAAAVYQVAQRHPGTFTGSSDHLVSQAFYFDDPEGNGVELYWDRDRTEWSWVHGRVEVDTLFLDPNRFLREHLTEAAAERPVRGEAVLGHVHLCVGDVASAREFYVDRLGFDTTAELGERALFVSAGGYHHHIAVNTWRSAGAGPRTPALGLGRIDIVVPTGDDLGEVAERMRHYEVPTRDDGRTLAFEDPWANAIRLTAAA